jgi:hypothetical protein
LRIEVVGARFLADRVPSSPICDPTALEKVAGTSVDEDEEASCMDWRALKPYTKIKLIKDQVGIIAALTILVRDPWTRVATLFDVIELIML